MRTAVVPLFVVAAALSLPCCAGCSEECAEQNQGAAGCPCSSDQDCSAGPGAIFLCIDGACALEDPPAADTSELTTCDDGRCDDDFGCGIGDVCFAAPACQRIDGALQARLEDDTTVVMGTSRSGCLHSWSAAVVGGATFATSVAFDLEGNGEASSCQAHWFAADRVGSMVCDGVVWAIAPNVDGVLSVRTCVGGACTAVGCRPLGPDGIGVCQ